MQQADSFIVRLERGRPVPQHVFHHKVLAVWHETPSIPYAFRIVKLWFAEY